jgi:hypothetical protein
MNIIGIDPGQSGAIAKIRDDGFVSWWNIPDTPQDILTILDEICEIDPENKCFLEQVHGMPGQGGQAMFNFGKNYGYLEMALLSCGIPTETVTPQKWQKFFQLGTRGTDTKVQWKNKLKAKAQQLFPKEKITLANCDALLIAYYGYHMTHNKDLR